MRESHHLARALQPEDKLTALKEILDGKVTDANLTLLDEEWTIEERCKEALSSWNDYITSTANY